MNTLLQRLGVLDADYNRIRPHVEWPFPLWGLLLLAVLLGVGLYWSRKGLAKAPPNRRRLLLALRFAVSLLFFVLVAQLALALQHVRYDPVPVAILVDRSASMKFDDGESQPRAERVRRFFEDNAEALDRFESRRQVDYFEFGDRLEKTDRTALAESAASEAQHSRILSAIEGLSDSRRSKPYAQAILISDGADNGRLEASRKNGSLAADLLGERPIPLVAVQVGEEAEFDDFGIAGGGREEFAFTQNPLTLKFTLTRRGFEKVRVLGATLYRENQPIGTQSVDWSEIEGDQTEVSFKFTPRQTGDFLYKVALDVPPEDHIETNNVKVFALKIIRDKIRVLHITGQPSYDTVSLRRLMKENPNIELVAFYILRTMTDMPSAPQHELSLIPFPKEELFFTELHSFDLVIFHNFKFSPYVPALFLENLRNYIDEGGAFAMIGGRLSFGEGGYDRTGIEAILPVSVSVREGYSASPLEIERTEAGRAHPITRLRADEEALDSVWEGLPELEGLNFVGGPSYDALTLMEAKMVGSNAVFPLLAIRELGKGRTLAYANDTSWRWGFGADPESPNAKFYANLWNRAIRWLIRDPFLERIRVATTQTNYVGGQPIAGNVTLFAPDYSRAADQEVVLEIARVAGPDLLPGQSGEIEVISGYTDEKGEFGFEHQPTADGGYRLRAFAPSPNPDLQVEATTVASYTAAGPETLQPGADPQLLKFLASVGGGAHYRLDDFDLDDADLSPPAAEVVDRQRIVDLWDSGWLLALMVGLLGYEWWLRKKTGLA